MAFNRISAAEAASLIKNGYNIGLSGFTPAGTAKATTAALAKIAEEEHAKGHPFQVGIFTGASTGESCDGILSRAKAIRYRAPYTTNKDFRKAVNSGEIAYNDIHLSQMAQEVRYGFMGKVDVAIIEACELTPDGKLYLTAAGGISPTLCRLADKIIVELNAAHSKTGMGLHDVYELLDPPYRREIPIYKPSDRIGKPYIQVDPKKIVGVVETNWPDEARSFSEADPITDQIGQNVADFLASDLKRGIIPSTFLPLQSGVGNIANAVLGALGRDTTIPPFEMYTEVLQDAVVGLIRQGRVKFGSTCSLTVTNECLDGIYQDMDFFRDKLVLRPSEVSNNPEVVRRLGVISINTAIEADLYGNVNSTHIGGTKMMNGIGGSGDFTRNAYISIFTCPSVAKEGMISAIVPMVPHVDHSEHSVNIIITEQGVADLRGKSPKQRAEAIIENCVHPEYKQLLWDYVKLAGDRNQTPQLIPGALGMHAEFAKSGDMRNTNWSDYLMK
ncbi:MAG: acetyl-CoA hydrolase/transferase family protein [Mediterranea sp.]|jgi:succinate CoA transferase|nr:acetyl-CoA hydrolase/transferase family protein [Mediterranea sp.]